MEKYREEAIRDAFGEALVELGKKDSRIVVLDADVAHSTQTLRFGKKYPQRFFNVGIAEANMVNIAAGFASAGYIPFVSTFSFLASARALEQVRTSVAYPNLDVKIAAGYGGLSDSYDGATHQSVCDLSTIRGVPNMTLVVMADAQETRIALPKIAARRGPVFFRLSRAKVPVIFDKDHSFEIGKANILKEGSDLTIFATGIMVARSLEAQRELERQGISARIVEIHTLKPIDQQTIEESAKKTGAAVTAEEHSIIGGLGGAVSEALARSHPVPVEMVGISDTFAESGGYEELLEKYGLTAKDIIESAKRAIERKNLN